MIIILHCLQGLLEDMENALANLHVVVVAELDHDLKDILVFMVRHKWTAKAVAEQMDHLAECVKIFRLLPQLVQTECTELTSVDSYYEIDWVDDFAVTVLVLLKRAQFLAK